MCGGEGWTDGMVVVGFARDERREEDCRNRALIFGLLAAGSIALVSQEVEIDCSDLITASICSLCSF